MEEYIKKLLEQIRCEKAHSGIEAEIRSHIEDQIEDNMASGMDREEAEKSAVADMGDPVETGVMLDRIHKPKVAWGMIGLMAVISIIGIVIHNLMGTDTDDMGYYLTHMSNTMYILGFICMVIIYYIDYTAIARISKILGAAMIAACIYCMFWGKYVNGARIWISLLHFTISIDSLMLLYIPIYAAIMYQYRHTGRGGFIKSLLWMICPIVIIFRLPGLTTSIVLAISMMTLLTLAIINGWFKIHKTAALIGIWSIFVGIPFVAGTVMYVSHMMADYQIMRIKAFLTNSGDANYLTNILRTAFYNSKFIGNSGADVISTVPSYNSNYIFTYIAATYGVMVAVLIGCILAALIISIFAIARRQKNQLGMMMGCGSGMAIMVTTVINILVNMGLLPPTRTILPLISGGGSMILVMYILVGIVLCIYKYKNIYTSNVVLRKTVFNKSKMFG